VVVASGIMLRSVSCFFFHFLVPLDLSLLGLKRFWTRDLRSTPGVCGVLAYILRSFGDVNMALNEDIQKDNTLK
jgi:hypothetical protein